MPSANLAVDLNDERDLVDQPERVRRARRYGSQMDRLAVAGALPELLGDVRRERRDENRQRGYGVAHDRLIGHRRLRLPSAR